MTEKQKTTTKRKKLTKAEIEERKKLREEKRVQKERDDKELKALLIEVEALTTRIPAEYQQWGYTKTSGYKRLQHFTHRHAGLKYPKLAVIRECVRQLKCHAMWTMENACKLAAMPEKARKLPYEY